MTLVEEIRNQMSVARQFKLPPRFVPESILEILRQASWISKLFMIAFSVIKSWKSSCLRFSTHKELCCLSTMLIAESWFSWLSISIRVITLEGKRLVVSALTHFTNCSLHTEAKKLLFLPDILRIWLLSSMCWHLTFSPKRALFIE